MLARVEALIARALDAGATEEERRTSAVIAVRLIREHRLLGVTPATEIRYVYRDRQPEQPRRRVIASKYAGNCQSCGDRYAVGASIAWARDAGAVCLACHRQARAA